jgi:NADPH:quinone reductase-like Zn-dependent oxidoreductase
MKAIVYNQYGSPDVLRLAEVEKPTPKDDEVLVKIHAASVNKADWLQLTGKPFIVRLFTGGLRKPSKTILGADIAGTVTAVGKNVRAFRPGDAVFGDTSDIGCGGFAEYVAVPEQMLVMKPANVSFEEAAAVPLAGVTALQGLRDKSNIQTGQKVLIYGASGGVGSFAVQVAKAFGAEVTAVCSTRNVEMARSIGADHVIDYKKEHFVKSGEHYDLIFAANGNRSLTDFRRVLKPNGLCVVAGGSMPQIFRAMLLGPLVSMFSSKKIINVAAKSDKQDLEFMAELLEAGKIRPVIDRCYPLSETAEGLRYLGETHPSGKVVISMAQ